MARCPCGATHNRKRSRNAVREQSYCLDCHNKWMRENRPKYRDLPPQVRAKANARAYANAYQRRGKLLPQPCGKCGDPDTQKHHEDYSKPLDVKWFCKRCHMELHWEG